MASSSKNVSVCQQEAAAEFISIARQIDCTVHHDLEAEKRVIRCINEMAKMFGQDELVTVGSAVDGSKVNVPGDIGDIDVLLVSKQVVLDQSLFDYNERYPAFLHVRSTGKHARYFRNVQLIDGKYIPVAVLKSLQSKFFAFIKFYINGVTRPGITGGVLNMIRNSAVGLENVHLDIEQLESFNFSSPTSLNLMSIGKMACPLINTVVDMVQTDFEMPSESDIDDTDDTKEQPDRSDVFKTAYRVIDLIAKEGSKEEENVPSAKSDKDGSGKTETFTKLLPASTKLNKENSFHLTSERSPNQTAHTDSDRDSIASNSNESSYRIIYERKTSDSNDEKKWRSEEIQFKKQSSADLVAAFPFEGWPSCANEWLTRKRKWPSKETVERIIHVGCHIVAKRPLLPEMNGDPKNEDHSPEHDKQDPYFRVSFSMCELVLSSSLSEPQLLCWRVLKAFQKAHLRSIPRVLTSYHWKNVALWLFEETGPEFWTEESVLEGVCRALDLMREYLRLKFVPSYFVRSCNLIDGCRNNLIQEVYKRILQVRTDPVFYLKDFIKSPPSPEQYTVRADKLHSSLSEETAAQHRKITADGMAAIFRQFPQSLRSDNSHQRFQTGMQNGVEMLEEMFAETQPPESAEVFPFKKCKTYLNNLFQEKPGSMVSDSFIDMFSHTINTIMPEKQKPQGQDFVQEVKYLVTGNESSSSPSRTIAMAFRCFLALAEHNWSEEMQFENKREQREANSENCQKRGGDSDTSDEQTSTTSPKNLLESFKNSLKKIPKKEEKEIDLD